jgi:outer membrane protein TolC
MTRLHRPRRTRRSWLWLVPLVAALAAAPAAAQDGARPGLTLDDVVRATLDGSAQVRAAQAALRGQAGGLRQARGSFDPVLEATASAQRVAAPSTASGAGATAMQTTQQTAYSVGVEQKLRNGVTLSPELAVTRQSVLEAGSVPHGVATAALDLTVPLGRGRGAAAAAAGERAAASSYEAARHDLGQARAEGVLASVEAYWAYAAAWRKLEVLRASEARAARLVDETRRMIAADARPAADSVQVLANLASRRAARLSGEQEMTEARTELAVAMGIAADAAALAPPADTLPTPLPGAAAPDAGASVRQALSRRADLAAALARRQAAQALSTAARAEARPKVDLDVTLGYSHAVDDAAWNRTLSPLSAGQNGFHAEVALSTGMPLGNRTARGALEQSEAAREGATLAADDLARTVALRAAAAVETLARSGQELALADEAVRLHALQVDNETEKYRLGGSTLLDVITAQDGLTSATLSQVDGRLRYAVAAARLRFETGEPPAEAGR